MLSCPVSAAPSSPTGAVLRLNRYLCERAESPNPVEDFESFEFELRSMLMEVENEAVGAELSKLDVNVPVVLIDGVEHRRVLRSPATYQTGAGAMTQDSAGEVIPQVGIGSIFSKQALVSSGGRRTRPCAGEGPTVVAPAASRVLGPPCGGDPARRTASRGGPAACLSAEGIASRKQALAQRRAASAAYAGGFSPIGANFKASSGFRATGIGLRDLENWRSPVACSL